MTHEPSPLTRRGLFFFFFTSLGSQGHAGKLGRKKAPPVIAGLKIPHPEELQSSHVKKEFTQVWKKPLAFCYPPLYNRAMKSLNLTRRNSFDFGRLTPIRRDPETKQWICRCACGNETSVRTNHLTSGKIRSCGCLRRERMVKYHQRIKELS